MEPGSFQWCPVAGQEATGKNCDIGGLNHLNIRRHFFTVRVTKHWHRLPNRVVSPCLEILKSCLDSGLASWL